MASQPPRYPEEWLGENVVIRVRDVGQIPGVLVDVNEYGATFETEREPERPQFTPWASIIAITPREGRGQG